MDIKKTQKDNITLKETGPHQVQMKSWISCAPFEKLLNMEILKADDGEALLTMPVLYDYMQGGGLLHGGALVSLADTAVVMAIKSILPPQTHFATLSMESKFLYPVKMGMVTAKASAKLSGHRVLEGNATVFNDQDKAVMSFSSIFKVARDARIRGVEFKD